MASIFSCVSSRDKGKDKAKPDDAKKEKAPVRVAALAWASTRGDLKEVKHLIESGYSVDQPDDDRSTPLTASCWNGQVEVARFLLQKGADATAANLTHGWNPLFAAASKGHLSCVKLLLCSAPALDVATRDKHGQTAEDYAAVHLDSKAPSWAKASIYYLLFGIRKASASSPATKAALRPVAFPVAALPDAATNAPFPREKPVLDPRLSWAAYKGDAAEVQSLLSSGHHVDEHDDDGATALCAAAWVGSADVTRLLMEKGANAKACDTNGHGWTALFIACARGHVDVVKALLETPNATATPKELMGTKDKQGVTPLQIAEKNGRTAVVAYLKAAASSASSSSPAGATDEASEKKRDRCCGPSMVGFSAIKMPTSFPIPMPSASKAAPAPATPADAAPTEAAATAAATTTTTEVAVKKSVEDAAAPPPPPPRPIVAATTTLAADAAPAPAAVEAAATEVPAKAAEHKEGKEENKEKKKGKKSSKRTAPAPADSAEAAADTAAPASSGGSSRASLANVTLIRVEESSKSESDNNTAEEASSVAATTTEEAAKTEAKPEESKPEEVKAEEGK